MAISAESRTAYRQLRGLIGWGILIAWLIFWWVHLDAIRHAAMAMPCEESGLDKAGDFLLGAGHACKAHINNAFNAGMFAAVVVSPVAFVIGHFGAILVLGLGYAAIDASERKQEQEQQRVQQTQFAQMAARTQHANNVTRQENDRYEFITRLGAVDDQLVVMSGETGTERVKMIELNVTQSLRDLHAKFKFEEMRHMYLTDQGVRQRVDLTLAEMRRLRLEGSRHYGDLAAIARA